MVICYSSSRKLIHLLAFTRNHILTHLAQRLKAEARDKMS